MSSLRLALKQSLQDAAPASKKKRSTKERRKKRRYSSEVGEDDDDDDVDDDAQHSGDDDESSIEENEFSGDEEESDEDNNNNDDDDDDDDEESMTHHDDEGDDPHGQHHDRSRSSQHDDDDDEEEEDHTNEYERKRQQRKLKKKIKHSAANKIQSQWKKKKGTGDNDGDDDDDDDDANGKPKARSGAGLDAQHSNSNKNVNSNRGHSGDNDHNHSGQGSHKDGDHPDDAHSSQTNPNSPEKKKKKGRAAKTVTPPIAEVIEWSRTMPIKKARKHVAPGLRVKVRFATKVKRDGVIIRKKKWFGGRVAAASKEGSKIRIKYDDGTAEISKFPDKDVVVDDTLNGEHAVNANKFIPPELKQQTAVKMEDKEEDAAATESKKSKPHPSPSPKQRKKLKNLVTDIQLPSPPVMQKGIVASAHEATAAMRPGSSDETAPAKVTSSVQEKKYEAVQEIAQPPSPPIPTPPPVEMESVQVQPPSPPIEKAPEQIQPPSPPIEREQLQPPPPSPPIETADEEEEEEEEEDVGNNSNDNKNRLDIFGDDEEEDDDEEEEGLIVEPKAINKEDAEAGEVTEPPADNTENKVTPETDQEQISAPSKLTIRLPNLNKERRDSGTSIPKSPKLRVHLSLSSASYEQREDKTEDAAVSPEKPVSSVEDETDTDQMETLESDHATGLSEIVSKKRHMDDVEGSELAEEGDSAEPAAKRSHIEKPAVAAVSEETTSHIEKETTEDIIDAPAKPEKTERSSSLTLKLSTIRNPSRQDDGTNEATAIQESTNAAPVVDTEDEEAPVKVAELLSNKEEVSAEKTVADTEKQVDPGHAEPGPSTANDDKHEETNVSTKTSATQAMSDEEPPEATGSFQKAKDVLESEIKEVSLKKDEAPSDGKPEDEPSKQRDLSLTLMAPEEVTIGGVSKPSTPRDHSLFAVARVGRKAAQEANERLVTKKPDDAKIKSNEDSKDKYISITGKKRKKREKAEGESDSMVDDNNWVQCDQCKKWRIIPSHISISSLPERWYCSLNTYDPERNTCDAPEQTARTPAIKKKKSKKARRQSLETVASADLEETKTISRQTSAHSAVSEEQEKDKTKEKPMKVDTKLKEPLVKPSVSTPKSPRPSPCDAPKENVKAVKPSKASKDEIGRLPPKKKLKKEKKTRRLPEVPLEETAVVPEPLVKVKRGRSGKRKEKEAGTGTAGRLQQKEDAQNVEWVQCEKCDKWRKLPPHITAAELPDIWYCEMNTWNPGAASCSAAEDKAEGQHDIRVDSSADVGSNKLSYRNLIFGSGRKVNRPLSERARAAESIFVSPTDDPDLGYPTVAYANSSVYAPRGSRTNIIEDESDRVSVFDLMNHSNLWAELRAASRPCDAIEDTAGFGDEFAPKYIIETLPSHIKSDMKKLILKALGNKTLLGEEVLLECQCRQFPGAPSSWAEARAYCTKNTVVILLCELVREGKVQLVQSFGENWTIKDWNPRYRLAVKPSNDKPSPPAPRQSKCMKIAKPWKNQKV